MHKLSGGCHCGNILLDLELSEPPGTYSPRACDCTFCSKHAAAYISDARGSLRIRIGARDASRMYRQGSGQAEFLICANCGVLIGVLYRSEGIFYAAVNAKAIDVPGGFGDPQGVSPQTLSDSDKVKRWRSVWFAQVSLT
jgi:hypothetical protein